jgi:hypothetical protein
MIDISMLSKIINKLGNIYSKAQLLKLELREYYDVIKPGSYYVDKRIVFIFQFPIVSPLTYHLYKLSIIPNFNHTAIIPLYPYIATDELHSMYIEAECPTYSQMCLCEENINRRIRNPDSIHNLIHENKLDKTCHPIKITVQKEAMEKLDDQRYASIFANPTKVQLQCEREDHIMLQGNFLATIPQKCSIRTEEFIITTKNNQVKGQPLKLMELSDNSKINVHKKIPEFKFSTIDLRKLHTIEENIMIQKPMQENFSSPTNMIYHTTIPMYVLLLSVISIAVIIIRC